MTLSELRTLLKRHLDEDGIHRTTAMLNDSLNIGYILLSVLSQACEHTESFTYEAERQFCTITNHTLLPVAVYWNSTRLYPTRMSDMDQLEPTWLTVDSSTPVYYFVVGTQTPTPQLWLHPRPDEDGRVRLTHAIVPDVLVNDADVPRVPTEYHHAIVHYAYGWELLKEREPLAVGKAFRALADFSSLVDTLRDYVYRRTPDRDWEMMPWDAEAFRLKLHDFEQRAPGVQVGVEGQLIQQ